ncbi:Piwi-like protein 1 [Armadillidium vulgare]|nr:Piwi-like protein 1 [Armadillidium vulgare]
MSMNGDSVTEYDRAIVSCAGRQMVLLLLPNNNKNRYSAIKQRLSVNMGIPSQCILTRTLAKAQRLMSVATKVAIQMNCKLGGDVWQLKVPVKDYMMIGYDAYHDTQTRGASFGAVVSSVNNQWTKYHGQVSKHMNKEELTNHFSTNVKPLEYYVQVNNRLPASVVVFRDGVGEGQVGYVKEHEVAAIKQCFEKVGNPNIKLAFIVVSKRINTRVFLPSSREPTNPPPGTVVDSIITLPESIWSVNLKNCCLYQRKKHLISYKLYRECLSCPVLEAIFYFIEA